MNKGKQLIFVGGTPRSGSTVFQRMLNAHPEIDGGPEFDIVPAIMALWKEFHRRVEVGRIDYYLNAGQVDAVFADFISNIFQPRLKASGKRFLSEKTPHDVECFSELRQILPDAKYVILLRDPRAVAESLLRIGVRRRHRLSDVSPMGSNTAATVRQLNQRYLRPAARVMAEPHPPHLIYYEDLVSDQEQVLRKLCDYLGLAFAQEMMDHSSIPFELNRNWDSWRDWHDPDTLNRPVFQHTLERWRKTLRVDQRIYVENHIDRSAFQGRDFGLPTVTFFRRLWSAPLLVLTAMEYLTTSCYSILYLNARKIVRKWRKGRPFHEYPHKSSNVEENS